MTLLSTDRAISILLWGTLLLGLTPAFAQTAVERSNALCEMLQRSSVEKNLSFVAPRPAACSLEIDKGYRFSVAYDASSVYLGFWADPVSLNGDASAFWLRLSAFDNLVHSALGVRQQRAFDELNKLATRFAREQVRGGLHKAKVYGRADKAVLGVFGEPDGLLTLMVSASVKDIDHMRKSAASRDSGGTQWQHILRLSLQAFAEGAKGASATYKQRQLPTTQNHSNLMRSCYTNFAGSTASTTCF